MSIAKENDPALELEIPRPVDELGRPRACSIKELFQMIQERTDLLFHSGKIGRKFGLSEIEHAQWAFDDPLLVKVTLKVPVPPLLAQMRQSKRRNSSKSELLRGRGDQLALDAVHDCIELIEQAERDIQELSNTLNNPSATAEGLMQALAATSSPAARTFAVHGGAINLNVDGRNMSLEAQPARTAVEYSRLTLLLVRLGKAKQYGAPYSGRVLEVREGPAGVCRPAARLTLGYLQGRCADRALLEMARDLEVDVLVRVRLAVSSTRLTALTAEVFRVENHAEIFDALLKQRAGIPDCDSGPGQFDSSAQGESC